MGPPICGAAAVAAVALAGFGVAVSKAASMDDGAPLEDAALRSVLGGATGRFAIVVGAGGGESVRLGIRRGKEGFAPGNMLGAAGTDSAGGGGAGWTTSGIH
jgi:hypothetical protein